MNAITLRRNLTVFVMPETTAGTLVVPSASGLLIPVGLPIINQTPSYTDSDEIKNTRDTLGRFQDRMGVGTWNLSVYSRPSGTAGSAPQEANLLTTLLGLETVTASTSVAYTQMMEKPSVSIWVLYDNTLRFCAGATASDLKISAETKGALKLDFSGEFMTSGVVGTQGLAAAVVALDTTATCDDASCFSVGGLVEFYNVSADSVDDNSSAGYTVTAVDVNTNVITVSPAIASAFSIGDVIRPFLPAGTEVGTPIENRKSIININSVATNVTKFDISINDPAVYNDSEIAPIESYISDRRKIDGSISLLMRQNDAKYFIDNLNDGMQVPLSLVLGTEAGSIVTVSMPTCAVDVPTITDSAPTIGLDMPFTALGSAGEDSLSITFT